MILAVLSVLVVAFVAHAAWRQRQLDRRWQQERQRLEEYGERLAARNGHPHSGDVINISEVGDREPPLTPEQMRGRIGY